MGLAPGVSHESFISRRRRRNLSNLANKEGPMAVPFRTDRWHEYCDGSGEPATIRMNAVTTSGQSSQHRGPPGRRFGKLFATGEARLAVAGSRPLARRTRLANRPAAVNQVSDQARHSQQKDEYHPRPDPRLAERPLSPVDPPCQGGADQVEDQRNRPRLCRRSGHGGRITGRFTRAGRRPARVDDRRRITQLEVRLSAPCCAWRRSGYALLLAVGSQHHHAIRLPDGKPFRPAEQHVGILRDRKLGSPYDEVQRSRLFWLGDRAHGG